MPIAKAPWIYDNSTGLLHFIYNVDCLMQEALVHEATNFILGL